MKIIMPVDACIKRFYRGYVTVDENATNEEIRAAAEESILQNLDNAYDLDPDMYIEEDDIVFISPDEEGAWTEEEDKEIEEILRNKEA